MSTFPGSPRLLKCAVIGLDPAKPSASMVVFQYNPDSLSRKIGAMDQLEQANPSCNG